MRAAWGVWRPRRTSRRCACLWGVLLFLVWGVPADALTVTFAWDHPGAGVAQFHLYRQAGACPLPRVLRGAALTLVGVDSEVGTSPARRGAHALDDTPATFWQTAGGLTPPPHPHWISLALDTVATLDGVRYLARQDGVLAGTIKDYVIEVSTDQSTWSTAHRGQLAAVTTEQAVTFPGVLARWVRLVALSDQTGGRVTSAAELALSVRPLLTAPTRQAGIPATARTWQGSVPQAPQCWVLRAAAADGQESAPSVPVLFPPPVPPATDLRATPP